MRKTRSKLLTFLIIFTVCNSSYAKVKINMDIVRKIERNYHQIIAEATAHYKYKVNSKYCLGEKRNPDKCQGTGYLEINPALIKAIIYQESAANPNAMSRAKAKGLMQVIPQTSILIEESVTRYLNSINDKNLKSRLLSTLQCNYSKMNQPLHSIHCCTLYLASILSHTNDLVKALSWYNAGKIKTENGLFNGRIANNPETINYVSNVLELFELFKSIERENY